MNIVIVLVVVIFFFMIVNVVYKGYGKCLFGDKYKEFLFVEESMVVCKFYKDVLCCISDFIKQFVIFLVKKVGKFLWILCNNILSFKCEVFMVVVECFYCCLYNMYFWKNFDYLFVIMKVFVCVSFCNGWFDVCKDDLICVKNWIIDFNKIEMGVNICKKLCKNFSDYFINGKDFCESMWGISFVYKEIDCLQMNFMGLNLNDDLVKRLFEKSGVLFFIVSLVVFWIFLLFIIVFIY